MTTPNISYLNEQEIELYYKLFDIKEHVKTSSALTIEASLLGGPKVSQKFEKNEKDFDTIDKLFAIWDYLKTNDLISTARPNSIYEAKESEGEFIFENVIAHKLFFPKSKLTEFNGLDHLVVWFADPDTTKLSDEPYTFTGTFLFLVEALYDRGEFRQTLSGCSALQAMSNIISGQQFYTQNWDEPLGRNNANHPLQKLQDIGAVYLQKQEIKTIYRKRYMTNEQCFMYKDKKYRCNDLLGYPLFVS